ncbi:endonuclease/exonuclease/phosphatase family protein [Streptomyces chiangmaiensis]|uniref:Endonuclease/exonuclease/phosphatase family protein n=1 Tax=Streptomyces chiangmaiensis TaxID=766497 RepID=A0ABU7FS67_9ACTN|nr:endonuclease/exonuclease/phosphatase family protein [Streptomyces chiangmaiensis]MED7826947.1 endonuclease/exonuclease/phosphatase family protein [Streptomyces chiangmaiensis]
MGLKVNGLYVAAEVNDSGDQYGKLRARSTSKGSWETFSLHTDHIDNVGYGTTITLRNEENGLYVTSEINTTGAQSGMLRARGTNTGSWERFYVIPQGNGQYALKSAENKLYVSAEFNYTGGDEGLLRARSTSIGSWERFTFEKVGGTGDMSAPSAPTATASGRHDVASWNLCANNNPSTECKLQYADADTVASSVASDLAATPAGYLIRRPEAIFFQEICEKAVKPLELQLENQLGGGWDVRFAPTYYKVVDEDGSTDSLLMAQKTCSDSKTSTDRGSFGIALAVKDTNTWYRGYTLPSPYDKEQRPALCATVPDAGTVYCNAHFSSGSYFVNGQQAGDDPDNIYRPQQADGLRSIVDGLQSDGYTPFYGGDLNTTTADVSILSNLYSSHQECGQATPDAPHTGEPTDGNNKIDYIFGPVGPTYSCEVVDPQLSDHRAIHATITF